MKNMTLLISTPLRTCFSKGFSHVISLNEYRESDHTMIYVEKYSVSWIIKPYFALNKTRSKTAASGEIRFEIKIIRDYFNSKYKWGVEPS